MISIWERYRWLRATTAAIFVPTLLIYTNYEKGDALREIHIFIWTAIAFALFWQEKHVRHKVVTTFFKIAFFPIFLFALGDYSKKKLSKHEERMLWHRRWEEQDRMDRKKDQYW